MFYVIERVFVYVYRWGVYMSLILFWVKNYYKVWSLLKVNNVIRGKFDLGGCIKVGDNYISFKYDWG